MRKVIISLLILFFTGFCGAEANSIDRTISSLQINKSAVSVSVRDIKTGNTVYSLNDKTPMNPASTLKLITFAAAVDTLGYDYDFSTELYKSTNNDLYIKLSGDPLLTSDNLTSLMKTAKKKNILAPKNVYIDATIFDNADWGEGWQWDDDLNPLMPKFGAYNLDNNVLKIDIIPNEAKAELPPQISVTPFYPLSFMNNIETDYCKGSSSVTFSKNSSIQNIIDANGVISGETVKYLPVPNPRRYFVLRLEDAMSDAKIEYYSGIKNMKVPSKNIYMVDKISHGMDKIADLILKNSNNAAAETVFKTAGAVRANSQGTTDNSLKMLNSYFNKLGLDPSSVTIVDGSGVSKNNLMNADFMTSFLRAQYSRENFDKYEAAMVEPGEGTLKNRMLYFKGYLKAKTGTLSGVSAIAGYITTRKGKVLAFDIMINDAKASSYDKKNVEEQILRQVYTNY